MRCFRFHGFTCSFVALLWGMLIWPVAEARAESGELTADARDGGFLAAARDAGRIEFQGETFFSHEALRAALADDAEYQLAIHPAARAKADQQSQDGPPIKLTACRGRRDFGQ
ncbi:MAG: hypothetical protein U0992_09000 [Planctomycetaceae bacterium]